MTPKATLTSIVSAMNSTQPTADLSGGKTSEDSLVHERIVNAISFVDEPMALEEDCNIA